MVNQTKPEFNTLEYFEKVIDELLHGEGKKFTISIESEKKYNFKRCKQSYVAILSIDSENGQMKRSFCNTFVRNYASYDINHTIFSVNAVLCDILEARLSSCGGKQRQYFVVGINGILHEIEGDCMSTILSLLRMTRKDRYAQLYILNNGLNINKKNLCSYCGERFSDLRKNCPLCEHKIDEVDVIDFLEE